MSDELQVLIASRGESSLKRLRHAISPVTGIEVEALLMVNGNADPLLGINSHPDVLILHTDGDAESLQALARRPQEELPPLIVVGKLAPEAVKFAVRAGARDMVSEDEPEALVRSLEDLLLELRAENGPAGDITAVMNAKGGSGATFIACNLAHLIATSTSGPSLVVDLDFQFASLPHYFDVAPKRSFLDALANAPSLDFVAVEAYAVEHSSGVSVMAPIPDSLTEADFDITERVRMLLPILKSRYRHLVVDVPRHVDEVSTPILRASDHIIVVLQQSLPSIRDAVRLKTTLVRELGIDQKRLQFMVNRHLKTGAIELDDIRDALGEEKLLLVPNHFKSVAQAIDLGVPLAEYAPSSPVVRALSRVQSVLFGEPDGFRQAMPGNQAIKRLKQWSPF
jgi:pilus assembly protein CpaE